MARFRLTFVFIVCVLLVNGAAVAQEQDIAKGGTIQGYIVDTTPAQLPIVGVRVQIDNGKGHIFKTTSAETGKFVYRDIPAGDYLINIRKFGYQSRIGKPVSVTSGGVHHVPLTMNKQKNIFTSFQSLFRTEERQEGTLQLRITTPSPQSAPIENAEVKIWQLRSGKGSSSNKVVEITGTSDADGQYRRDNLLSGVYVVAVRKDGYHTMISMTVRGNQITTAAVKFPISNGTADTYILPSQETDTKWIIRGKIFDNNFQQTPVSGVKVRISGRNLKPRKTAYSNAGGEYEFAVLPGHYSISLYKYKDGYEDATALSTVPVKSGQSSVTVIEEGMFVVYEAVAKGNVLALKHGISKRSFSERHRERIRDALLSVIFSFICGILGIFVSRFLNKPQRIRFKVLSS
ncbi:MAG: carboxypeptidase-like regulatory domain-containing protein [Candidatus Poribacteria bacterium]|nr:carboxypeptidase-like regulatory domain-containing protein [Candidatus Poribacteria bacterium]MDE0323188.1 carboxypeptidase-like regulatory domain-containing protein [Candidatus Poribacteria bacterium]